jgi:zinc transporter ZupT
MGKMMELFMVMMVGLLTTSSSMLGAAIGLYARMSKKLTAAILAFAAGSLISALVIDLAYKGALELNHHGFTLHSAWGFIAGGFFLGAIIYFTSSLYLEGKGAAIRSPTQFKEYALARKHEQTKELVGWLSKCDLLRHLPPEAIEHILPKVQDKKIKPGEILFYSGDSSDALYIIAKGKMEVVADGPDHTRGTGRSIAELGPGSAFGEMGLLSGEARTATIRCSEDAELLEIAREDFQDMIATDPVLANAVLHLSHERSIQNLSIPETDSSTWAKVAMHNLDHISKGESNKMLLEAAQGKGAGMAIVLGNILDTIPGCLVIGAGFAGFEKMSLTLMVGMFLGGIPEAAVSAVMLTKAGYKPKFIYLLWSTVLIAGMVAAVVGKQFIGNSESLVAVFCEAVAGGAVLALVSHTMIPEAIHKGGSIVVLPTVGGFLFALYITMSEVFV